MIPALTQKERTFGWLLLVGIVFPLLVNDWNYSRSAFFVTPLFLSYPSLLASACIPTVIILQTRMVFSADARCIFNRFLFLTLIFSLVMTIQGIIYPAAWSTYDKSLSLYFTCLLLWGLAGFLSAANPVAVEWLLDRFALCAAWGSLFSFSLTVAGVPRTIPFGIASWPMRLFFLFGFCWYLTRYWGMEKTSRSNLVGMVACGLEVIITLQKPIIWASAFSVLVLLLVLRTHLSKRQFGIAFARLIRLVGATILILLTINSVFQGVVTKEINQFIFDKVLHITENDEAITLNRTSGSRIQIWTDVLKDFGESPWVGSGIKKIEIEEGTISLHNGYLDLLFISGICGVILVACGIGLWLTSVVRSLKFRPIMLIQASCLAYFIGILMFNIGGVSRLFVDVTYFIVLVYGMSLRLATDNCAQTPQP